MCMNWFLDKLPWILTGFRAAAGLAPWLFLLAGSDMIIPALLIPLALLSDIFDGIIARSRGVASELLRRADGWADLVFVISYTLFCAIYRFEALQPYWPFVLALALYKGASTLHDFHRYGRGAAFHFWSAKLWALPYYGVLFQMLWGISPIWLIWPTLAMGFIAITEEFVAVSLIPVWMSDQPNVFAAIKAHRALADRAKPLD